MKSPFLLTLFSAAVLAATVSFIAHLFVRFETVRLGYEVGKAREQQEKLAEQYRLLALEAATLRQIDRVEAVGRAAFGMEVAPPGSVIPVEHVAAPRISGRTQ